VLRPTEGKVDALILDHAGCVLHHGLPDDPVEWTLAEDRRAENPRHASRSKGDAPTLRTCPECKAIRTAGKPCTACGWLPRARPGSVEVIDGELELVDPKKRRPTKSEYSPAQKAQFYSELLWIARERGYQEGWVSHKYHKKFGVWPPSKQVSPALPSEAVRAWVRSQQIAWAKAQGKARAI